MTDTTVSFGATTSLFDEAAAEVKSVLLSLRSTVAALGTAFTGMSTMATGALARVGTAAQAATAELAASRAEVAKVAEGIPLIGGAAGALLGPLAAAFAVDKIVEFSRKMGEMGESVEHTGERLGLTTAEVQKLGAMATLTGIDADKLTTAISRLDRNFAQALTGSKQQSAAFKELGINIHEVRNQSQLLDEVASHWSHLAEGIQQNTVAIALFGRAGAALIPFLQQGKEGIDALNRIMAEYGIQNDDAIAKSASLGEAWNENKLAMEGLGLVMAQSVAPALEQLVRLLNEFIARMIASYQHGGVAKSVFDALAVVLKLVASGVIVVAAASYPLVAVISALVDIVRAAAAALSGNMVEASARAAKSIRDLTSTVDVAIGAYRTLIGLWSGKGAGTQPFKPPPIPKDQVEGLPGPTGKKKKGGAGSSEVSDLDQWRTELAEKLALDTSFGHDDAATTLAFWESKLSIAKDHAAKEVAEAGKSAKARAAAYKAGAKEILAVEDEIAKAKRAKNKEDTTLELAELQNRVNIEKGALTTELDLEKQGAAQRLAIVDAAQKMGTITARQAIADKAAIHNELYALEVAEVDREYQKDLELLQKKKAVGDLSVQDVAKINREIEALEAAHLQRIEQMNAASATRQLEDQLAAKEALASLGHGWVDPIVSAWSSGIEGMIEGTTSFRQAVQGVFRSLVNDIVSHVARMVENWIVSHLFMTAFQAGQTAVQTGTVAAGQLAQTGAVVAGQTAQTAATVVGSTTRRGINFLTTMKIVAQHAVSAAAGAYSALAVIPIIGPILGAAAAVATFAAVMALGALASAAGGWENVPRDQIAQLHKEEMVLPAKIASPLRDAIDKGGFGIEPGGNTLLNRASTAADERANTTTHENTLNYSPTVHAGEPDLMRLLERQGPEFMAHIANLARNGEFRF